MEVYGCKTFKGSRGGWLKKSFLVEAMPTLAIKDEREQRRCEEGMKIHRALTVVKVIGQKPTKHVQTWKSLGLPNLHPFPAL